MTTPALPARKRPERIAWRRKGELPRLADLPIPREVRVGKGWTGQMREMADHIGPWATLSVIAAFGGEQLYIPADPAQSPFAELLDAKTCAKLAWAYGGNRLLLPVARSAVDRARRAVVIAAVRAKKISGADAQKIIGTSRTYVAHLVNHTDEGVDAGTRRIAQALPRQPDLFSTLARD